VSHKATNWLADLPPKDLTNAEFRILFVLCDCHNPSAGCFPKQSFIMARTGRGSSSVNAALNGLEEKGLIRRAQQKNAKTGKQENTRYILGFECEPTQGPTPNSGGGIAGTKVEQTAAPTPDSGDGTDSGFLAEPTPVFGQSRLLKTGVVYNEEPVKEPVKEPCSADAAHTSDFDFDGFYDQFARIYPRMGDRAKTEAALRTALGDGEDPKTILAGARAYAAEQQGNKPMYIAYSQSWAETRRWRQHAPEPKADPGDAKVLEYWAQVIKEASPAMKGRVSGLMAEACLKAGLVTAAECRAMGALVA
jgi:hypothetical protein